jgi:hypothetical protein
VDNCEITDKVRWNGTIAARFLREFDHLPMLLRNYAVSETMVQTWLMRFGRKSGNKTRNLKEQNQFLAIEGAEIWAGLVSNLKDKIILLKSRNRIHFSILVTLK